MKWCFNLVSSSDKEIKILGLISLGLGSQLIPEYLNLKSLDTLEIILLIIISLVVVTLIWHRFRERRKLSQMSKLERWKAEQRKESFFPKPNLDYLTWLGVLGLGELLGGTVLMFMTIPIHPPFLKATFGIIGSFLLALGILDGYHWQELRRAIKKAEEKFKDRVG